MNFSQLLAPAGFNSKAFVASYGMAECSLAISFAPLDRGLEIDRIDAVALTESGAAVPVEDGACGKEVKELVFCGKVLPGHEVEIRNEEGKVLPERQCGVLYVRGPSVMTEYLGDPEATREVLSPDGWLNTGDLAYLAEGQVVITGRKKDLIIINGRNIWPQDIEILAEQQQEIRSRDAAAFSVPGDDGEEIVVLVVQCRHFDETERCRLVDVLRGRVREEFGIDCIVELVPPHHPAADLFRKDIADHGPSRFSAAQASSFLSPPRRSLIRVKTINMAESMLEPGEHGLSGHVLTVALTGGPGSSAERSFVVSCKKECVSGHWCARPPYLPVLRQRVCHGFTVNWIIWRVCVSW